MAQMKGLQVPYLGIIAIDYMKELGKSFLPFYQQLTERDSVMLSH